MNEENNQNAPILGLNGGGGGGMLPMSDFPSGTYKIKFSDEYYQGDNHTNKLIKGRIVLLQNDDVNDGNYFVGNRMIYDDAFVDEVVSYVSNFDVNYYIPSLGGDFMNEHSAIMYNDIILDYEMVGGMFNPTNEYHFVLDEEWYNKHYGDDSNKVLRTLAKGQSDITRHEAYTKAQGLNWANANSPTYTSEVVVTIKSLATGKTMKVYLDLPMLDVRNGVNITRYTGHFYEEEFMVTWSDGIEITGLPLMYPYTLISSDSETIVIDMQNHSLVWTNNDVSGQQNIAVSGILFGTLDGETPPDSENYASYMFSRFGTTPSTPTDPDTDR